MNKIIILLLSFMIFAGIRPLSAQDSLINTDIMISNHTFFSKRRLDRIYFAPDGQFFQQLETDWNAIKSGELLKGEWLYKADKKELCMDYTAPKINKICFDVVQEPADKKENQNIYSLYDKSGQLHFVWRHYKKGNYLLSPQGMKMISLAWDKEPVPESEVIDQKIAQYYVGKIFHGFNGVLAYIKTDDLAGYARHPKTKEMLAFKGTVENLRTINHDVDDEKKNRDDVLITLGDEFLDAKNHGKAYFYAKPDLIYVQGDGVFDITPIDDHPEKGFFDSVR